jgi:hypothetical protein
MAGNSDPARDAVGDFEGQKSQSAQMQIEELNFNFALQPPSAKRVLCIWLSLLLGEFDKVVFKFYIKVYLCF